MGQVKIWLNSQPDISEIPKFLLLVMIIITVFCVVPFGYWEVIFYWIFGSFFAYIFYLYC